MRETLTKKDGQVKRKWLNFIDTVCWSVYAWKFKFTFMALIRFQFIITLHCIQFEFSINNVPLTFRHPKRRHRTIVMEIIIMMATGHRSNSMYATEYHINTTKDKLLKKTKKSICTERISWEHCRYYTWVSYSPIRNSECRFNKAWIFIKEVNNVRMC